MTKLSNRADHMREDAMQILLATNMKQILSELGNFEIVGSLRLNTMYRRDIDLMVFSESVESNFAVLATKKLKASNMFRSVTMTDYQTTPAYDMPLGYYWELIYKDTERDTWKFDVWYLKPSEKYSGMVMTAIKNFEPAIAESSDKRDLILRIKDKYFDGEKYMYGVKGIDIYKAVLEKGVISLVEFESTIKKP